MASELCVNRLTSTDWICQRQIAGHHQEYFLCFNELMFISHSERGEFTYEGFLELVWRKKSGYR